MLRLTQLWRAYGTRSAEGSLFPDPHAVQTFAQGPLRAPTVFKFFSPFYAPPGEFADAGRMAPILDNFAPRDLGFLI